MDWQPIETAPKDGTKVLIAVPVETPKGMRPVFGIYAAWWDPRHESDGWDDEADEARFKGAWTDDAVRSFWYEETQAYEPTHWRPLPDPPTA